MTKLFSRLWADDRGAVISVEWILFVVVLLLGLVPALAGVRNQITAGMLTVGELVNNIPSLISVEVAGFEIQSSGGTVIATIAPFTFGGTGLRTVDIVATSQAAQTFQITTIDPAP